MDTLTTQAIPVGDLALYHRNPRHGNIPVITESLEHLGQYRPIVVNTGTHTGRPNEVLAGNHTLLAARQLGWETIQAVHVDVDEDTAARIVAVDNRSSDLAHNDDEILAELLQDLPDLSATGFTQDDLDELLADLDQPKLSPSDGTGWDENETAPEPPAEPFTRSGDVWELGTHRIVCGDVRDPATLQRLLGEALVNVAFTSPPYASQRAYDESSGFKPIRPEEYVSWFEAVQANVRAHLAEDGSWFVNIKEHAENGRRHLHVKDLTIAHVRRWSWRFIDELAWVTNGMPGRFDERFKNRFEPVFHFAGTDKIKFRPYHVAHHSSRTMRYAPERHFGFNAQDGYAAEAPHKEEEGLALPGNVLEIAAEGRGSGVGRGHTAVFPVRLPAWFIRAYSDPGDAVLDPFMGSGTTLIAAHLEDRTAYGVEISPAYCDVICTRWQNATGIHPIRDGVEHDFSGDD